MGDIYTEILVPRQATPLDIFIKVLLILLTGAAIAAGVIWQPQVLIGAAGLLAADILLLPRLDVEYEYLYINGELDVDRIYSKTRRRPAAVFRPEEIEFLAPVSSLHWSEYGASRQKPVWRTVNFSSGRKNVQVYALAARRGGKLLRVLLEPNEKMIKDLCRKMPGKVFSD